MPLCTSVYKCLVVTCWERADLLAPVCGVFLLVCHFRISILGQVWYLIVSIPDLCALTYSELIQTLTKTKSLGTFDTSTSIFAYAISQSELPRPVPWNSVESYIYLGCSSRIYFDNVTLMTIHNVTLTSQKPCQHNLRKTNG